MQIVHTKNDGGLEAFTKKLEKLKKGDVAVGVFGDGTTYENGQSVLDVAIWMEFGVPSKNIPARSFIRSTTDIKKGDVKNNLKTVVKNVLKGSDKKTELNKVGRWFAGEVQKTILSGGRPVIPNAPATVKQKGGNNTPLVGKEGLLRRNITWQIG